ncbi:hydrogenase maturation factor HoxX-like [Branchiostoma lanceolatum]|uniref:hydrogenase maturation factor HoxX-like n=1 Tax=Branchiostoma lanceolatum TaxID=7740 RepID=UPI003453A146
MIRSATMINRVAWRSMMSLQKAPRAVTSSHQGSQKHGSSSQQPFRPVSQHPSQQASQQPLQQVSQLPQEFSPLPWVDFAAPGPAKMAGNPLKVTFLCDSFNGLSQRLYLELTSRGHHVTVHEDARGEAMTRAVEADRPDLVLCPFQTRRVPAGLYNNPARPVLIVHPGIPGDRGPSSIDWALKEGATEWGVTVLQADDEMDAGDIWATCKFPVNRQAAKSSLYSKEVTQAAVLSVLKAIDAWDQGVPPTPLDYGHPDVCGELKRKLTAADRQVDWAQPAEDVARAVRACDSQPGALGGLRVAVQGHLQKREFVLFGACVEGDPDMVRRLKKEQAYDVIPGDVIGRRNGAVLVACGKDTAAWISHLKASPKKSSLKLPATSILPSGDVTALPITPCEPLPYGARPKTFQDVWTTRQDGVCYVHFDFYNGAMSTDQCRRLEQVLLSVDKYPDCSVVVLMGGYNFFSNGIHLNVIENSECAATESWANITAIDDVVKAIFRMRSKVTVAALQGNAGAGGVMMALAADQVWSHAGVVLNPHYRKMALFGSEYWTYSLPRRVGNPAAEELTNGLQPLLATEARDIGMIDDVIGYNAEELNAQIRLKCLRLQADSREILRGKKSSASSLWTTLENHRRKELANMQQCFNNNVYHDLRQKFVYH